MSLAAGLPHAAVGILTRQHISWDPVHTGQHHFTRTSRTPLLQQTQFSYCMGVVRKAKNCYMLSAGVQSFKVKPVEATVQ